MVIRNWFQNKLFLVLFTARVVLLTHQKQIGKIFLLDMNSSENYSYHFVCISMCDVIDIYTHTHIFVYQREVDRQIDRQTLTLFTQVASTASLPYSLRQGLSLNP